MLVRSDPKKRAEAAARLLERKEAPMTKDKARDLIVNRAHNTCHACQIEAPAGDVNHTCFSLIEIAYAYAAACVDAALADPLALLEALAKGYEFAIVYLDAPKQLVVVRGKYLGYRYLLRIAGRESTEITHAEAAALLGNPNTCPESSLLAWGESLLAGKGDEHGHTI